MKKQTNINLTEGTIWKQLVIFSLPVMLSLAFQQLYNITNSLIVGNYVSSKALSAISATNSISVLPSFFFYGMAQGSGILIAHYYGAKDHDKLQKGIESAVKTGLVGGIILTVIMEILITPLMHFSNVRSDLFADAELYLRIYSIGSAAVFLYEMVFSSLRSLGDSRHPLYYLIMSSVMNVVLGIVFVRFFNLGVAGVAIASVVSQATVDLLGIRTLFRMKEIDQFNPLTVKMDGHFFKEMSMLGIPMALQNMLVAISNLLIQSHVNMFADEVISGIDIANKVVFWVQIPMMGLTTGEASFIGQNIGARKYDRVHAGIKICIILGSAITIILGVLLFISAGYFVQLFDRTPLVVSTGIEMTRWIVFAFVPLTWSHVYNGACRAAGNVKIPSLIAITMQCVLKYLVVIIGLKIRFDPHVIFMATRTGPTAAGIVASRYFHLSKWTRKAHLRR